MVLDVSFLVRKSRMSHIKSMLMRPLWFAGLMLVAPLLCAAPLKMERLEAGGKAYTNVTILGASATDLYITHANGIANVKLKDVDANLQKKYNYDRTVAEKTELGKAEQDTAFYDAIGAKLAAALEEQARVARNATNTSEESFADPISAQSPLGKKGPELVVEKWLGEKPSLEGKFVLLVFWEPWSIPCRKLVPQLNGLHQRSGGKLAVVGVTTESQAALEALPELRIEFPCAIDTKAELRTAAGATSIPAALLLDPKGVVCFQGHPAALDELRLRKLLAKSSE